MVRNSLTLKSLADGSEMYLGLSHISLGILENTRMFSHTHVGLITDVAHRMSVLVTFTITIDSRLSDKAPGKIWILVSTFIWKNAGRRVTSSDSSICMLSQRN